MPLINLLSLPMNFHPTRAPRWRILITTSFFLALAASGCDALGGEDEDEGRIVIGRSVDFVQLGQDTLAVRSILGRPTTVERGPGYFVYRYARGKHAGFEIYYTRDSNGRVENRTVFALTDPYSGKTEHGIGLGTSRTTVHSHLNQPDFSSGSATGAFFDRYESATAHTTFVYDEEERVTAITMRGPL